MSPRNISRWGGLAMTLGGLFWVLKAGAILLVDYQPPLIFEVAPLLIALGLLDLYMSSLHDGCRVYLVDRDLPGATIERLAEAQQAAIQSSQRFTAAGKPVRYIRSLFVLGEERCLCLFESTERALVQHLNDAAGLPYTRIIPALDLTPGEHD